MEKLRRQIREFARERDWEQFHTPKNLAMDLCIEASELMEHFLWLTPEQSKKLPRKTMTEVADEIGDVMICLAHIADKLGIDPVEAAQRKLKKTAAKYPVSKVRGKALKYTAYQKKRK